MNFYNEIDPRAAAWLRVLIAEGLIPAGDVDERSICEISPAELIRYTQCHFFAGIGGWPLALRLGGWSEDEQVWTGSCPCQPFSVAGKGKGNTDERHLWPVFRELIRVCKPKLVFGEQVASPGGRKWLSGTRQRRISVALNLEFEKEASVVFESGVRPDLEAMGYAVGAADLCSASVGAPNIRQRLYWVAESTAEQRYGSERSRNGRSGYSDGGADRGMVDSSGEGTERKGSAEQKSDGENDRILRSSGESLNVEWLGDAEQPRLEGHAGNGDDRDESRRDGADAARPASETGDVGRMGQPASVRDGQPASVRDGQPASVRDGQTAIDRGVAESEIERRECFSGGSGPLGFWSDSVWHACTDGKQRRVPVEPSFFPLAARIPGRVAMLKGFGNAICPPLAAEFIKAYRETVKH